MTRVEFTILGRCCLLPTHDKKQDWYQNNIEILHQSYNCLLFLYEIYNLLYQSYLRAIYGLKD